jgi:hypothetical protein
MKYKYIRRCVNLLLGQYPELYMFTGITISICNKTFNRHIIQISTITTMKWLTVSSVLLFLAFHVLANLQPTGRHMVACSPQMGLSIWLMVYVYSNNGLIQFTATAAAGGLTFSPPAFGPSDNSTLNVLVHGHWVSKRFRPHIFLDPVTFSPQIFSPPLYSGWTKCYCNI